MDEARSSRPLFAALDRPTLASILRAPLERYGEVAVESPLHPGTSESARASGGADGRACGIADGHLKPRVLRAFDRTKSGELEDSPLATTRFRLRQAWKRGGPDEVGGTPSTTPREPAVIDALLLCASIGTTIQEQQPAPTPAPATVDLHVQVAVKTPLLCELTRRIDAKIAMSIDGRTVDLPVRVEEEWRFVEETQELAASNEKATRYFQRAFRSDCGVIDDPELNGVTIEYESDGSRQNVACRDDRAVRPATMEKLIKQVPSLGWFVVLPEEAAIGAEFDVALDDLLPALLDAEHPVECEPARLKLERLDDDGATAVVEGAVEFSEGSDAPPVGMGRLKYSASAELRVDLAAHRLRRIRIRGAASAEGNERVGLSGGGLSGGGLFEIDLRIAAGPPAAAAAKQKPTYRSVERKPAGADVSFALPSYWFEGEADGGTRIFYCGVEFDTEHATRITVNKTPGKLVAKDFLAGVAASEPDAKTTISSSPLGKTVGFTLMKGELKIGGDAHPLGDECILVFRVIAPAKRFDAANKDFQAARKTLKHLRAK